MRVTAIMLSDHATVREGLLHVLGGGINRLVRDPLPAPLGAMLALMLHPDSADDLMQTHNLVVTIKHAEAEGDSQVAKAVMTLRSTAPAPGPLAPVAVVVPLQGVPITQTGTHTITVSLDEEQASAIEFVIVKAADSAEPSPTRETLHLSAHAAMAEVLRTAPQYKMRPADLAAEINRRGLYRMRDGRPIETQQVHARAGNYPGMFERDSGYIKLKEGWRTQTQKPRGKADI